MQFEKLEEEARFLATELNADEDPRGYKQTTGGNAKKSRDRVSKAIRAALARIDAEMPKLREHLRVSIPNTHSRSYSPTELIDWAF